MQRVPETESQGRIHTSAATVAVLPEAEDVEVQIDPKDLQIDTYRSGGGPGASMSIRPKAPYGSPICPRACGSVPGRAQPAEEQGKGHAGATKAGCWSFIKSEKDAKEAGARKSMVGSGDRSERIRTYNFPQGRVTDHRINLTLYRLESFLDGDMDEVIDALIIADRAAQLSGDGEGK
mgnify:CR=1 FL=1